MMISVEYQDSNNSGNPTGLINTIKKTVGKMIINDTGELKSEKLAGVGVRG
jgi:hypothetical protein